MGSTRRARKTIPNESVRDGIAKTSSAAKKSGRTASSIGPSTVNQHVVSSGSVERNASKAGEIGPPEAMFLTQAIAWRELGVIEWRVR